MVTHIPPACEYGSMAEFPAGTNKVVLLDPGNPRGYGTLINSTWEWDGTDFTEISTADVSASPPPHTNGVFAYDGVQMVSFGGQNADSPINSTYGYSSGTWTDLAPATSPSARYCAAAAYLAGTGIIMFGGKTSNQLLGETYLWDGSTWAKQSPATVPAGRFNHCMAASASIALMGFGQGTLRELGDVYSYSSSDWTKLTLAGDVPPARSESAMCYDVANSLFVLFSGVNDSKYLSDCYTSPDGITWTEVTGTLPSARRGASFAYDATSGTCILFGGISGSDNKPSNEVWSFNGSTLLWSEL